MKISGEQREMIIFILKVIAHISTIFDFFCCFWLINWWKIINKTWGGGGLVPQPNPRLPSHTLTFRHKHKFILIERNVVGALQSLALTKQDLGGHRCIDIVIKDNP